MPCVEDIEAVRAWRDDLSSSSRPILGAWDFIWFSSDRLEDDTLGELLWLSIFL